MGKWRAREGGGGCKVKYMKGWDGYLGSGDKVEPSFWSIRVVVMVVVALFSMAGERTEHASVSRSTIHRSSENDR